MLAIKAVGADIKGAQVDLCGTRAGEQRLRISLSGTLRT